MADIQKGDSAVLECAARDLPSGVLSVTFQANDAVMSQAQYVDLPEGLGTLTTHFTIPETHRTKDKHFTCQIQQSRSMHWKSSPTGNLFGEKKSNLNL